MSRPTKIALGRHTFWWSDPWNESAFEERPCLFFFSEAPYVFLKVFFYPWMWKKSESPPWKPFRTGRLSPESHFGIFGDGKMFRGELLNFQRVSDLPHWPSHNFFRASTKRICLLQFGCCFMLDPLIRLLWLQELNQDAKLINVIS